MLYTIACNNFDSHKDSQSSATDKPQKHIPKAKTAIFAILGDDLILDYRGFNRWNSLPKTKGQIHLFASNKDTFSLLEGTKHVVSRVALAQEMANVQLDADANRLIIFINSHGGMTGNWCYENINQCSLSEDTIIELLQHYSKSERPSLEQVLVITNSCYNKAIMDRFAAKIKNVRFPFEISYIQQINSESCPSQCVADSLMENYIIPLGDNPTDKQLEEFLTINNMQKFIAFSNKLLPKVFKKDLIYEVKSPSIIKLSDFGFDTGIYLNLFSATDPVAFLYNTKPLEEFLKTLVLSKKFYKYIDEVTITTEDDKDIHININGDYLKALNILELNGKKYKKFDVILRNIDRVNI